MSESGWVPRVFETSSTDPEGPRLPVSRVGSTLVGGPTAPVSRKTVSPRTREGESQSPRVSFWGVETDSVDVSTGLDPNFYTLGFMGVTVDGCVGRPTRRVKGLQ